MRQNELCELMNMVMVYDDQGNVLVERRVDPEWSGITFPGGHVEPGESFVQSAIREIKEETGLTISNLRLCGIKQWIEDCRHIVLFYQTNCFSGELVSSEEGEVFWMKQSELASQELAFDFEYTLEIFKNEEKSERFVCLEDGEWVRKNL